MKIERIHPELRKVIGNVPSIPIHNRLFLAVFHLMTRFVPRGKSTPEVTITEQHLNNASIRIYRPQTQLSGAGLLWIHGGGYIIGTAAINDRECMTTANDLGLVVVSVDYRLAPKHPFPCAMDDCFEAWQWFQAAAAKLGVDPRRIAIAGQSAGGGLAAGLAQRIRDESGIQPAAQALFCPMLDDRTAARLELDQTRHRIWNNKNNRAGWTWYLGQPPGQAHIPPYAAAARREDLSGLPPAWIGVGDVDLFYEEDRLYAERLNTAGVYCRLYVVPGAPHAFESFVPNALVTCDFYRDYYRFLRQSLGYEGC